MKRFQQIEGLRGYLALWVLVGHLIGYSGIALSQRFYLYFGATKAVDVFIILSGFVITHMILERPESYAPYIIRRFFRLWPVLIVCCFAGWLTYDLFIDALNKAPGVKGIAELLQNRQASVLLFPFAHVAAHISMLHGALPDELLRNSDGTFLGTAWSTSLEWQFYLVAPFGIWLARKKWGPLLLCLACIASMVAYDHRVFGSYYRYSTILGAGGYFLIGITSRLALRDNGKWHSLLALLLITAWLLPKNPSPIIIWSVFYLCLLGKGPNRLFDAIFSNKLARYLGELSYSIYLVHIVMLGFVMWLITRFTVSLTSGQMMMALIPFIPLSVAVSAVTNRIIEKPGIAVGKRLALGARDAGYSDGSIKST